MKITHAAAKVAVLAAVFLGLVEGGALATNEPIPGIDIIVKKNPGGIVTHATTDKAGKFSFNNLAVGTYELQVTVPQTKSTTNTSRSNIKKPGRTVQNGSEVFDVAVTAGTGQPAPVTIVIAKEGGKITGAVTGGGETKEPGVNPNPPKEAAAQRPPPKEGGSDQRRDVKPIQPAPTPRPAHDRIIPFKDK